MRVFLFLFLFLSLSLASSHSYTNQFGVGIEVSEESGEYNVTKDGELWFSSSLTYLFNDGCFYVLEEGGNSKKEEKKFIFRPGKLPEQEKRERNEERERERGGLTITNTNVENVTDPLFGDFTAITIFVTSSGCSPSQPLQASFQFLLSLSSPFVLFNTSIPSGLSSPSLLNPFSVSTSFPSFSTTSSLPLFPSRSRTLTWQGLWNHGWLEEGLGEDYMGGAEGGVPLVVWNKDEVVPSSVAVLSPFDEFMTSRLIPLFQPSSSSSSSSPSHPELGERIGLACGLAGTVISTPEDLSEKFILYFGNGVTKTLNGWGKTLLQRTGKRETSAQEAMSLTDPTNSLLGYWTDNGAYYYYQTVPETNYAETMEILSDYHNNLGLPVGYYQLDSWWYYQTQKINGNCTLWSCGGGVTDWSPRPDVFPNGITPVQQKIGKPLVTHNRYWSTQNVYEDDYDFHNGFYEALPSDDNFWPFLLSTAKEWGVHTYEQDWLVTQYREMGYTQASYTAATKWVMDMDSAAQELNMTIQYCMPLPQFWLMSTELTAVTQSRVTGDYLFGPNNFDIGKTSVLVWSLGLFPFKDVFWSKGEQPGNPWGIVEENPRMNAIISSLSSGPVGFGDGIGFTNISLIHSLCTKSGVLVRPDHPAFPIEKDYGSSPPTGGQIWSTTVSMAINGLSTTWGYLFSLSIQEGYNVTMTDLDLTQPSYQQNYIVVEYDDTNIFSPYLLTPTNSFTIPSSPAPGVVNGKQYWHYYTVYPLLPRSNWTLLGETNKILNLSVNRVTSKGITDSQTGFCVEMKGEEGEMLLLGAWPPQQDGEGEGTTTTPLGGESIEVKCMVGESRMVEFCCDSGSMTCSCEN